MDLVNNLQQLLYTRGLLVFPARCLQTGSIWPYLHGAVHNLINQPHCASFALSKCSPRDDPSQVGLAGVPHDGNIVTSAWPLLLLAWGQMWRPSVLGGYWVPRLSPPPELGLCEHSCFLGALDVCSCCRMFVAFLQTVTSPVCSRGMGFP